jgi:RNA 3'-terminal phosphate cyclase
MLLMDARDLIEKKQFSRLVLKGGTNVPFSPSIDHVQLVLLPLLERHFNVRATLDIKKRGYYPKGGGEVVVKVGTDLRRDMKALSPINLTEVGTVVATKVVVTGIMPEKKEWCDEVIYFLEEMIVSRYNWTAVREYDVDVTCVLEVSSTEKEGEWMTGGTGGVKSAMATDVYSKVTVKSKPKTKQEEQAEAHEKRQQLLSGTLKKTAARRGDALYGGLPSDGTIATKINKAHSAKRQRSNARAEKESKRLNTDFTLGMDLVVTTSTGCILHASDLRTGKNLTTQLAAPMLTTLLNKMDDIMKSGATVDEHTADQLLVYMATTSGKSTIIAPPKDHTSSQHLETAIDLVGQLAGLQPGFEVVVLPSGARKIICWTGAAVGGEVVVGGKVLEDPLWAKFRERQFKLGLGPDPYASEKDAKKKEEAIVRAVADMGKSKGKLMEEARARKREEEVAALFTDSEEGKK